MALPKKFYEEIYEKEQMWIEMIDSNLMNAYYLSVLKNFYLERLVKFEQEYELTGNEIMKNISIIFNNMIVKLDEIINMNREELIVDFNELKNLFLINILNNNISSKKTSKLDEIQENKKNLYELRNTYVAEDDLEDDFYYDGKRVA